MLKFFKIPTRIPQKTVKCCCSNKAASKDEQKSSLTSKNEKYDPKNVTKDDMKWRTTWHQKQGDYYYSVLKTFSNNSNQVSLMKLIQTPIDFRPKAIKKWWLKRKEFRDVALQSYLPERNEILGNELAAAHFIVFRGGSVKFFNEDKWIKANSNGDYNLPKFYQSNKILQAIDCSHMKLYYEGFENLKNLRNVEWLSLYDCEKTDDWILDRISNIFSHSLIYLDLRNCQNYTERGLGALYKMEKLKILCIDDMPMTEKFEMTCLMLQEVNPYLDIKFGE